MCVFLTFKLSVVLSDLHPRNDHKFEIVFCKEPITRLQCKYLNLEYESDDFMVSIYNKAPCKN